MNPFGYHSHFVGLSQSYPSSTVVSTPIRRYTPQVGGGAYNTEPIGLESSRYIAESTLLAFANDCHYAKLFRFDKACPHMRNWFSASALILNVAQTDYYLEMPHYIFIHVQYRRDVIKFVFVLLFQVLFMDANSHTYVREDGRCEFLLNTFDASSGILRNPRHSLPPNTTCRYHFQVCSLFYCYIKKYIFFLWRYISIIFIFLSMYCIKKIICCIYF